MVIEPRTGSLCIACEGSAQAIVRPVEVVRVERILRVTQAFFGIKRRGQTAPAYTGPPASRAFATAAVVAGALASAHGCLRVS